jgi:hypothetical protein
MPCVPALVRWMIVLPWNSTVEISNGELPKLNPSGARPRNSPITDLPDTGLAECERFLDRADHHDAGCAIRQGDGSGGVVSRRCESAMLYER